MKNLSIITILMNDNLRIQLPTQFTAEHQRLILKYLISGRRSLSLSEWKRILNGFDFLHQARVDSDGNVQTFKQIYAIHVEEPFADKFINGLLLLDDVSFGHQTLRARFARNIVNRLKEAILRQSGIAGYNLLLAYCLYFWESFALGYAFEVEIYRDLTNSGVDFQAHDIRERAARYSAYDLQILNLKGDIKTSMYFLYVARSRGLAHDFYITRFYEGKQQRTLVVLMQSYAWDQINGDTIKAILEEATKKFPSPVKVQRCKSRIDLLSSWSIMFGKNVCYKSNTVIRKQLWANN